MKKEIKHIWLDVEGTLTTRSSEFNKAHDDLRYTLYSQVTKQSVTEELKVEFEALYSQHGSNSRTFSSLGCEQDFWMKHFEKLDKTPYYAPDPNVYETIEKLHEVVPVSIFTNLTAEGIRKTLDILKIESDWITHNLSADEVGERKPGLAGFYEMIQRSNLEPEHICYVGDRVNVDILPAKKVGMQSCLVWSTDTRADYSFKKFEDILSLVE